MILLLSLSAYAAPAGYTVTDAAYDGCELSLGPSDKGVVPMHAECWWPDATLDKFNAVVSDWAKHADIFTVIVTSKVQRTDGDRALVYQLQRSRGIADREVLMWMKHETVDGFDRYSWTKATGETLTPASGNVEVARTDGYWEAKADPRGGILVEHQLAYDPGGSVPGFLVRWFQTSGLEANVDEMHAAVK